MNSQYQHYVPQLILRKFSDYVEPKNSAYATTKKKSDSARSRAKNKARVKVLTWNEDFSTDRLEIRLCSKTFGVKNMYAPEIELAFSTLEQQVSKVIKAVEHDFVGNQTSTILSRSQKDLLRKFLFIMAYRNRTFSKRFDCTMDEYSLNDREKLLQYVRSKGFSTLKEVWLSNIRAFIDVDMEKNGWPDWLRQNAYPDDALWFCKNMTQFFLCFCTPELASEEFLLTQNAYGIFEGPNDHLSWIDWHIFAPVNDRLVIVSRTNWLSNIPDLPVNLTRAVAELQKKHIRSLTSRYKDPVGAHSWLEDLPVKRPTTSYPIVQPSSASMNISGRANFSPSDTFAFEFFQLPSTFVQRINTILLEEAITTDTIVYKTETGLRKALDFYLEAEGPGLKSTMPELQHEGPVIWHPGHSGSARSSTLPEFKRKGYLGMLERVARSLGTRTSKAGLHFASKEGVATPTHDENLTRYTSPDPAIVTRNSLISSSGGG
ncbi:hypothetical protein LTS08_003445 [Lithohypha guttulata]|nr:hypothetical protein LTS08_003445 [Lithohypha guttulata]